MRRQYGHSFSLSSDSTSGAGGTSNGPADFIPPPSDDVVLDDAAEDVKAFGGGGTYDRGSNSEALVESRKTSGKSLDSGSPKSAGFTRDGGRCSGMSADRAVKGRDKLRSSSFFS